MNLTRNAPAFGALLRPLQRRVLNLAGRLYRFSGELAPPQELWLLRFTAVSHTNFGATWSRVNRKKVPHYIADTLAEYPGPLLPAAASAVLKFGAEYEISFGALGVPLDDQESLSPDQLRQALSGELLSLYTIGGLVFAPGGC